MISDIQYHSVGCGLKRFDSTKNDGWNAKHHQIRELFGTLILNHNKSYPLKKMGRVTTTQDLNPGVG